MSILWTCNDHNENARFTRGTQSGICFPGSSNNSPWACLCSNFNLWALRRTLMFCLNELTVPLDTALQSTDSPPPILSPVIITMRARWYQILDHLLRKATFFSPQLSEMTKKIWWFPAVPYPSRSSLICEAVCEQATLGWLLLPYSPATSSRWAFMSDAPSGHGVCESLGKSNNLQPTAIVAFFISGVRALHTVHACTFTDLIQTKSKAYWGAQLRKYKCVDISTCWLLQVVWHTVYFDYWYWLQKLQWMKD